MKDEIIAGSVTKKVIKQLQSQINNSEDKQTVVRKRNQTQSTNIEDPMIPASTPTNNPSKKKKNKKGNKNNNKNGDNNQLTMDQITANFQQLFQMIGAIQNSIVKNNA